MASELRVNTLKDASGNNSIGMSYVAEGTAKSWTTHQHGDTVDDSFNQSSLGDSGTGLFICNFSSNMNSTKYIVGSAGAVYNSGGSRGGDFCGMNMVGGGTDSRATDHCDVALQVGSTGSGGALMADRDWSMHIFHGDLA